MDSSTALNQEATIRDSQPVASADEVLARAIAAGDVAAWSRFFERFFPWAYRFSYHHLNANHADAEDLCSDILTTAARSMKGFNAAHGSLDVWLLGVARHRLARFCRRRRRDVPLMPDALPSSDGNEAGLAGCATDSAVTRQLVNRALAGLPERQATVLVGKYVTGYTVEEMARANDSTPKAIESLLSRARAAFRAAFTALAEGRSEDASHA